MKNVSLIFILMASAILHASAQELTEAQLDSIERVAYGADTRNLQELVVTADAPIVKVEGNRISYDVEKDPTAAGQSVLDMLRKVPMVAVDGQDNITLKGEGNFKIYVNGRPDPTLSSNASTILKAMPASAVSKVEVITDPGAKYDAEGTGGIINLVTERKRRDSGYNGSLNASVTNREIYAGVFGAEKWDRVTLNAGINYMNQKWAANPGSYESTTIYPSSPVLHELRTTSRTERKFEYGGANLAASWEASDNDLLNFSVDFTDVEGRLTNDGNHTSMSDIDGNRIWSYVRNTTLDVRFLTLITNVAWQHTFHRPDNYLSISYQFDFGKNSSPLHEEYGDLFNYSVPYLYHSATNDNYNRTHTLQLDYSNRLSEHALIEIGAKGIFRRNDAVSSGRGSNDLVLEESIESEYTDISQPQSICAVYALYKANYGPWSGEAGIRYEHTRMGIRYHYGDLRDFTNTLNDIVPNAGVIYSFSPVHALGLNYGMRISRPSLEQVNPYRLNYSPTEAMQGNPDLTSERINKISLTYRNFGRIFGLNLSLDYNHTGNAITPYSFLDANTVINTNANIGRKNDLGLNMFLLANVSQKVRLTLNGLCQYSSYYANGDMRLSNHGWTGNFNHNGEWQMPAGLSLNWYGGYTWGRIGLQSKSGRFFFYGIALARDFLRDKTLRLTLNATNFAQKSFKFTNTLTGTDFFTHTVNRMDAWRIGVSATWRFGKTQSTVKSVNSRITNDDLSTSGAGSPATSGNPLPH
ncbi:MAG: TonB-dependent receptor [Muribaculaceae bacterium]|nr:TonB-dependent receptor [Muribaculaceae bacterium]